MKSNKKFSLGVKIASILSCVAVLSVGFASWLIVNIPQPEAVSVGSFEVYEVVDNSVTLAYDWGADGEGDFVKNDQGDDTTTYTEKAQAAAKITFGKPASSSVQNPWLQAGDDVQNEKLTAQVKVTIGHYDQLQNFEVTLASAAYDGLGNLVATPTVNYKNAAGTANADTDNDGKLSLAELSADGVKGTVVVEFVFGWGSAFTPAGENQTPVNPFLFYNNQEYSATIASDANTKLTSINEALETAKYSVTFTCS